MSNACEVHGLRGIDAARHAYMSRVNFRGVEKCCAHCKWFADHGEGCGNCTNRRQNDWLLAYGGQPAGWRNGIDCLGRDVCDLWERGL